MADYRTMFDNKWLKAWDLGGRDWTLTIRKVEAGVLENVKARKKDRAPILWFKGAQKPLALNRTNSKTIAAMYGNETDNWVGKTVTLYATRTHFGPDEVDCIRLRPTPPTGKGQEMPVAPPPEEYPDRCDTGACGVCSMCVAAAADVARAEVSS
jgi:hypothetical protein